MKVLLAIPSYNRPYDIEKRTGWWIKKITEADVKVFVCPSQAMYYEQNLGSIVESGATQGVEDGFVKQLIGIKEYAVKHGYDIILKCDDDMVFKKNGVKGKDKLPQLIDEAIKEYKQRFAENDELSAICFCQPMEHLYSEKEGFKPRKKPFYGNYAIRTDRYVLKEDIYLFDDLFAWVDLKVKGIGYCETYFGMYQDALCGTNEGGLQSVNRYELSKKAYENAKVHYPLIERKTDGKFDGEQGFDVDVTPYKKI